MGNVPIVAIVGRPNVGKSAIFNCLVQKRIAIVHDELGVTRDQLVAECNLGSRPFAVVDTGGIEGSVDSEFDDRIRAEADLAMEMADVIMLVGDSKDGVTPVDRSLAKQLRSASPIAEWVHAAGEAGQIVCNFAYPTASQCSPSPNRTRTFASLPC